MIKIYTDGSSKGNPGPGGYGVVLRYKEHRKELSAGYIKTTNNRMELLAAIIGLETIKNEHQDVIIYTDSKYVADAVEKKWVFNWLSKGFKNKKNQDLWRRFLEVYKKHNVKIQWIKGHAGNVENERCDRLAVDSANGKDLFVDKGYVSSQ